MSFRPTDDTIQGRFSGVGNSEDFERGLSCAYDYPSGVAGGRYEFGVEALTVSEREALLVALRSGPGENTAGLTEEQEGDRLRFTQVGAAVLETVPDDWTMTFVVFPDAWTMVWSPAGGAEILSRQLSYSELLERQLYSLR